MHQQMGAVTMITPHTAWEIGTINRLVRDATCDSSGSLRLHATVTGGCTSFGNKGACLVVLQLRLYSLFLTYSYSTIESHTQRCFPHFFLHSASVRVSLMLVVPNPPPQQKTKTGGLTFGPAGPGSQGGSPSGGRGLTFGSSTLLPLHLSRHRKCLSPCF